MSKRLLCVLAALLAAVIAAPAMADPPTPAPMSTEAPRSFEAPEPETPAAPSFGVFMGAENAVISTMPDGTLSYLYADVPQADYEAFASSLEARYAYGEVTFSDDGHTVSFDMVNAADGLTLRLTYDGRLQRLTVAYPAGTRVERMAVENPFADDIEIELGQVISTDFGSISIDEVHLNDGEVFTVGSTAYGCWLGGTVSNRGSAGVDLVHDLPHVTLNHVTADGAARFHFLIGCGGFDRLRGNSVSYVEKWGQTYNYNPSGTTGSFQYTVPDANRYVPGSSSTLYIIYTEASVPEAVLNDADSILALTFELGGQNYVLYLRR